MMDNNQICLTIGLIQAFIYLRRLRIIQISQFSDAGGCEILIRKFRRQKW